MKKEYEVLMQAIDTLDKAKNVIYTSEGMSFAFVFVCHAKWHLLKHAEEIVRRES